MDHEEMEAHNTGERGNRQNADNVPILLNAREAAALCTMSESYFYRLNRKGLVPKPVRAGNMRRWRRSDLARWVAAGCPKDWNQRISVRQGE